MKTTVWLVIAGVIAALMESSLAPLPFVLVFMWLWLDPRQMERTWWLALGLGVIVDALSLRTLGISSLFLIAFTTGDYFLRKLFAGMVLLEWTFILCGMLVWEWLFVGRITIGILVFWVVICLVMEIRKRMGMHQEIRLR